MDSISHKDRQILLTSVQSSSAIAMHNVLVSSIQDVTCSKVAVRWQGDTDLVHQLQADELLMLVYISALKTVCLSMRMRQSFAG